MNAGHHPGAGAPKIRRPLLAHPDDIHCVVFHLALMAGYVLAFFLALYDGGRLAGITGPWSRGAFVLGAAMLLGWCSGINVGVNFHNHVHRQIFNVRWLNRWFGRTWTVSGGWPSAFWHHAHAVVHHSDLLGERDWTLPRRKKDGSFENPYRYAFATWPFRYAVALWRDFRWGRAGAISGREALRELLIFAALWSIPFFVDPVLALGLWLLPQWFANAAVIAPGMYAQHAGCVPKSDARPYGHSNTYLSRFFNLTMFNIGYHIEHHDHPLVHWSALPALHERLKGDLIEKGAHVLPFGYYRAGQLLYRATFANAARARFEQQHPDYVRKAVPPPVVVERMANPAAAPADSQRPLAGTPS